MKIEDHIQDQLSEIQKNLAKYNKGFFLTQKKKNAIWDAIDEIEWLKTRIKTHNTKQEKTLREHSTSV